VASDAAAPPLLEVRDLKVSFNTEDGIVRAVEGVSFTLREGEVLGIVGESGSGKSVTMMSVLRLINDPNARFEGEVLYKGRNVMDLPEARMREVRGGEIAMIFQDPMTSLNPVYKVADQIVEAILTHRDIGKAAARARAIDLLKQVGIPQADRRAEDYPHQFSGGMRQRAMIAMALANDPDILIADEPTTALDVTIQAQILELIARLKDEFSSAVILITHDLGVVAGIADRIGVMYAGRIVEFGGKRDLFYDPQHPYTWGLLGSIPRLDRPKAERLHSIAGTPPSLIDPPAGCRFRPRCPHAFDRCEQEPALEARTGVPRHLDRCWLDVESKRAVRDKTIHGEIAAA
jgi:oligopeptide/dipeptide ABC transporter ATP-binding protein